MAKSKLVSLPEKWTPDPDDPLGEDKKRLIDYLLDNAVTSTNPVTLAKLLAEVDFTRKYRREALQHQRLPQSVRGDARTFAACSRGGSP